MSDGLDLPPSPFAIAGARLRERDLAVMPCGPGTKFPGAYASATGWRPEYKWQEYCNVLPSRFAMEIWERWPDAGICLALGRSSAPAGMQLVAVDIDTEEPAEVAAILAVLPGSPVRKRGAKGETQFYLAPDSVPNRPYNDANKRRMLDLLCHGRQTVLPPTIHPTTGKPYIWTTLDTLDNFDVADLPILPADIADRLSEALAPFGHIDAPKLERGSADPDAEISTHRQLNDAALSNLAAWVPDLSLYKCREFAGKYKAVSHWRPSSSGRPLSARATNLAISPDGIKDCGEGKGYTPLDLVMAATGGSLDEAFRFLQERVAPAEPVILPVREAPAAEPENVGQFRGDPLPMRGNLAGILMQGASIVPVQPCDVPHALSQVQETSQRLGKVELLARFVEELRDLHDPSTRPVEDYLSRERFGWNKPAASKSVLRPTPFQLPDPTSIPRREWLYGRHLIRGEISLTLAPGGVGKTSLACAEAASLVSGRKLLHDDPLRKRRVWLWNGEEPMDELARRMAAVAIHYGLSADDYGDRMYIDNGHDVPLVLAEQSRDGVKVLSPVIDQLVSALKEREIDVMLVDPFVSTHGVNENDNSAIQRAASAWKEVAHRAGVAIGLAHHVRKLAGREATAEDSRGGDALVSKARDARTLNPMSSEDAAKHALRPADRYSYFSTGTGGKSNMAAKSGHRSWFRIVPVALGNGGGITEPSDQVAVVEPWSPPSVATEIDPERVLQLAAVMARGGPWRSAAQCQKRDDWIGRAVAEAFELSMDDGFQARAKVLIEELKRTGVLLPSSTTNSKRESVPTMILGDLSRFEAPIG